MARDTGETDTEPEDDRARLPWQNRWAVVLTLFFGGSSIVFFFVLTWLAPRYVALGWSSSCAGLLLSLFVLTQLGGNLIVSAVGDRLNDQRPLFALLLLSVIVGAIGVAVTPLFAPWGWALLLGVGAGGVFTLGLTLPVTYSAGPTATDGLTSMMLGGCYLIAALGPVAAGSLRDVTGSYAVAFGGLVFLGLVLLGISVRFKPDRETITATAFERAPGERA